MNTARVQFSLSAMSETIPFVYAISFPWKPGSYASLLYPVPHLSYPKGSLSWFMQPLLLQQALNWGILRYPGETRILLPILLTGDS